MAFSIRKPRRDLIDAIGKLDQLEQLEIWDEIDDEVSTFLYSLKQLTSLSIQDRAMSPDGIKALENALPNCKLNAR